jgi:hypothetical protein
VLRTRAIAAASVLFGASLLLMILTTGALAAPTEVTVRIEGKEKTLFEGPILTEGHAVQAASDTEPRTCDGTNNGAHPDPVPTPTAASVDAMEMVGQDFDAGWFPGFDDYFLERWGPDEEDLNAGQFWGILVNGVLTPVGGCQYGDRPGDEVLWVYDAFSGRRLLWLAAASDPTAAPLAPRATAHVEVGQPLALAVDGYIGGEGASAEVLPAEGVTVAPVQTDPGNGVQTVETGSPEAVRTEADGSAAITFQTPGWHRIKAQAEAGFIRSNRLDVCVEPEGGGGCGPAPADSVLRVPTRYRSVVEEERPAPGGGEAPASAAKAAPSNTLTFSGASVDLRTGTATLRVDLSGGGTLALGGTQVVGASTSTTTAGTVALKVRPTAKARKALRRKGRLRVRVTVAFTPSGGTTSHWERGVTLRLAPSLQHFRSRATKKLQPRPRR